MYNVYVRGFVGNLGTKILIENKYEELARYFNDKFLKKVLNDLSGGVIPPLFIGNNEVENLNIVDTEKVVRGGLLAALWKICERNKCGLRYSLFDVPILQGTIEICNYFDLNPYRLLTSDAQIIFGELNDSSKSMGELYLIGKTTSDKKRIRTDNDIESFLTKDYKDEIDKVLVNFSKQYEKHSNS